MESATLLPPGGAASETCGATPSTVKVTAALAKDGTMTLTVGGQPAVTAKAAGPVPRQPQEDFCLGHDNGRPVANYAKGKPFQGKITDLKVTIP